MFYTTEHTYKKEEYCTPLLDAIDPDYLGMFGLLLHSSAGKTMKVRAFSGEFFSISTFNAKI